MIPRHNSEERGGNVLPSLALRSLGDGKPPNLRGPALVLRADTVRGSPQLGEWVRFLQLLLFMVPELSKRSRGPLGADGR